MFGNTEKTLVPRNGHTLVVGIVARISGCTNQKEMSLDDQVDHAKTDITEMYQGPVDYRIISTKGKGERLDRPELVDIEALYRTGELDLMHIEDLGRMVRGAEAQRLMGVGVDHGTRTISPNDNLDTDEDCWEEKALNACAEHVSHNAQTSRRIKQKCMNRFKKHGGAPARPIYGYLIPDGVKTYPEWQKDPVAEPHVRAGWELLTQTFNCTAVADLFNSRGVPVGKYCRRTSWDGKMVRHFYANSLLKGMPARGHKRTIKLHDSGRRVSVKNPGGPCFYPCPNLAYFDPAEFDAVNAQLKARNSNQGRKPIDGHDPLASLPRKRSRFPGHRAVCWYCGRQCVWGGNGINGHLMCPGAREWRCWNSVGFDGGLAADKLVTALVAWLQEWQGLDEQFAAMVQTLQQDLTGNLVQRRAELRRDEDVLTREKTNLTDTIVSLGPRPLLKAKLDELEAMEQDLARRRCEIEHMEQKQSAMPCSLGPLKNELLAKFQTLAKNSFEMADLLRSIVVGFHVYLVRLIDGSNPLPRAKVVVDLTGMLTGVGPMPELQGLLLKEFTFDLFQVPQRVAIRQAAAKLAAEGKLTQQEIAAQLPEQPTATAVGRALKLDTMMKTMGIASPFVLLTEPPTDYPKLRRHRNGKYRFEPLPAYQQPAL